MATMVGKSKKQQLQEAVQEFGITAPETADETALAKMLEELGKKGGETKSFKANKAQKEEILILSEDSEPIPALPGAQVKESGRQIKVLCLRTETVTIGKTRDIKLVKDHKMSLPEHIAWSLIDSKAVVKLES